MRNRDTRRACCAGLVCAFTAIAGGCSFWGGGEDSCVSVEEYQEATSAPLLSVPPGLDRPDESGRLDIPPGPEPAEPLSQNAACLPRPPDFFDKPLTNSERKN